MNTTVVTENQGNCQTSKIDLSKTIKKVADYVAKLDIQRSGF